MKNYFIGDSNKVAQLNPIQVKSSDAAFAGMIARYGYTPDDLVTEFNTDLGWLFLFSDGCLTNLYNITVTGVPLSFDGLHDTIMTCLRLYEPYEPYALYNISYEYLSNID